MNNKTKKIVLVFVILLLIVLQRYMLKSDLDLVRKFKQPKFCVAVDSYKDDGEGTYWGLGYSFDVETFFPEREVPAQIFTSDFTEYTTKILGLEIDGRYVDYDFNQFEGIVSKVGKNADSESYYIYLEDIGQKIVLVDSETEFLNTNSQDDCEIREGDSVKISTVFFQFMQQSKKDNWLYYASSVTFLEPDID